MPLIEEVRELVARRIAAVAGIASARLFSGPPGGRITTAVLRDATTYGGTGLTWMADAGMPIHRLRKIAGHGSLTTTQRYPHLDERSITDADALLSQHLRRSPGARANVRGITADT